MPSDHAHAIGTTTNDGASGSGNRAPRRRSRGLGLGAGVLAAAGLVLSPEGARADEAYTLTVNAPASSVTYNFSINVPFNGTLLGENDPLKPANQQTRSKRAASLFSCGAFGATQNDPVNVAGRVTATGASPTPTNVRPAGSLVLGFNGPIGTAFVRGLNLQLLSSGSVSVNASIAGLSGDAFCTVNPSCSAPLPLLGLLGPIPLGSVSVTSISLVQGPGDAIGTLTPAGTDTFTVTIPVTVTASFAAEFNGAAIPVDGQAIPLVLSGTATRTPAGLAFTSALDITIDPPVNTTPTALPAIPAAFPADAPICPSVNLIMTLTVNNTDLTTTAAAAISAAGPRVPCPCDADSSGTLTVQDIFEFLARWFANDPRANFNGGAGLTVQDIFDFLNCWFGPPREC